MRDPHARVQNPHEPRTPGRHRVVTEDAGLVMTKGVEVFTTSKARTREVLGDVVTEWVSH